MSEIEFLIFVLFTWLIFLFIFGINITRKLKNHFRKIKT